MEPRLKVWVEAGDGRLVLSDYRVRLLELIAEKGSLADGAAEMGLSYRRAWGKLKEIEQNLGVRLVESVAGGAGGGHSRLTPEAVRLVASYNRFRHALAKHAAGDFAAAFRE